MKFLGYKLKKMREAYSSTDRPKTGMTQDELASLVGVSQSTIMSIEKGQKNPRPKLVDKLSEIFRIKPIEFYIDGEVLKTIFPLDMTEKQISFITDSQNLEYLNMAIEAQENQIPVQKLIMYIDLEKRMKEIG